MSTPTAPTPLEIKKKIAALQTIIKGHHSTIRDYRRDLENAELREEIARLKAGKK